MMNDTLKAFLNRVADQNDFAGEPVSVNTHGLLGDTPLHVATVSGDTRVMELLLDAGAEIDAHGELGNTPLHEAVGQRHIEAVKLLLRRGASLSVTNDDGFTPLQTAQILGHSEIESFLDDHAA
jgi:uncharacterized protein